MKPILTLALVLPLSGCVTTQVGQTICAHRDALEKAAETARLSAYSIFDPVKREAAISAINLSLAALARCPAAIAP